MHWSISLWIISKLNKDWDPIYLVLNHLLKPLFFWVGFWWFNDFVGEVNLAGRKAVYFGEKNRFSRVLGLLLKWIVLGLHLFYSNMRETQLMVYIEAVSVTSEYPQEGGSVCCCYDFHVDTRLQNCVVHCVLCVTRCVMAGAYHAEWEYRTHKVVVSGKGWQPLLSRQEVQCGNFGKLVFVSFTV